MHERLGVNGQLVERHGGYGLTNTAPMSSAWSRSQDPRSRQPSIVEVNSHQ